MGLAIRARGIWWLVFASYGNGIGQKQKVWRFQSLNEGAANALGTATNGDFLQAIIEEIWIRQSILWSRSPYRPG